MLRAIQGVRPDRPGGALELGLSDEIWETINACWDRDPGKRPTIELVLACFIKSI